MNIELIREYCLNKPFVTEEFPFDEDTPVYKVCGKIFLLAGFDVPCKINLKCEPEKAIELREIYDSVQPGYHMNKTHWNTITLDGSINWRTLRDWIDDSYNLVIKGLKKAEKEKIIKILNKHG